jgi:hypothetical protein
MKKSIITISLILFFTVSLFAQAEKISSNINFRVSRTKSFSEMKSTPTVGLKGITDDNFGTEQLKNAKRIAMTRNIASANGVFKFALDSFVTPGDSKFKYKWDAQGRQLYYEYYLWSNSRERWDLQRSDEFAYDQYGNLKYQYMKVINSTTGLLDVTKVIAKYKGFNQITSYESFFQNTTTNLFEGVERVDTKWDANDKVIGEEQYSWDSSINNWKLDLKSDIGYDTHGNANEVKSYAVEEFTKAFYLFRHTMFYFDKNNHDSLKVQYEYSGISEKLEPLGKIEYMKDADGNELKHTEYIRNFDSNTGVYSFVPNIQYFKTYHTDGRPLGLVLTHWDVASGQYVNERKEDNTFNEFDQNTVFLTSKWNATTRTWTPDAKIVYTFPSTYHYEKYINLKISAYVSNAWVLRRNVNQVYDANGNWVSFISMKDSGTGMAGEYNIEFTHDLSIPYNQILTFEPESDHKNMPLTLKTYKWQNSWVVKSLSTYYYTQQELSGVSKTLRDDSKIFPNPAKDFITVKTDGNGTHNTIELYNLQGSKVLSTVLTNDNKVSIEQLAKGAYIYKVNGGTSCFTGKLVKE